MVNPVRFTHFELRPIERLLLAQGQPVALGSRAFDVLRVLVDKATVVIGGLNPDYPGDQWHAAIDRMVTACRASSCRSTGCPVGSAVCGSSRNSRIA